MNWTDERVEQLKKLWSEGLSASQIATQLGGVSRNAVIGKVHRLKLSSRGRTNAPTPAPKAKRPTPTVAPSAGVQRSSGRAPSSGGASVTSAVSAGSVRSMPASIGATALKAQFDIVPAPQHQVMRAAEDVVVPISRRIALVELTERTCKWPNGDPLSDDFNFCGNDCAEAGPYCTYHSKLAFQPQGERRRAR